LCHPIGLEGADYQLRRSNTGRRPPGLNLIACDRLARRYKRRSSTVLDAFAKFLQPF